MLMDTHYIYKGGKLYGSRVSACDPGSCMELLTSSLLTVFKYTIQEC